MWIPCFRLQSPICWHKREPASVTAMLLDSECVLKSAYHHCFYSWVKKQAKGTVVLGAQDLHEGVAEESESFSRMESGIRTM